MSSHKVKTYLNILSQTDEYQELFSRVNQLNKMQQTFSALVPSYLGKSCRLGNISNNKLIIFAENGTVASKLKLISPSLLLQLQKIGWDIKAIRISVQISNHTQYPHHPTNNERLNKKKKLTPKSIASLQQLADKVSDTELESAIQALLEKHK